jgi:MFS family permease
VTSTGILTGVGHGFVAFAVSALLKPISLDLDTGRSVVSTAIGLGRVASGVVSPLVGRASDLLGSRPVVVAGMLVTAAGLVALGFIQREIELYFIWSLLISAGVAAGFTVALDKLVISVSREGRGMALAVRFSVAAAVATLLVPLITVLVEAVGWRYACFAWAALVLALLPIPLTFERPVRRVPLPTAEWKPTGLSIHLVPLMTDEGLSAPVAGVIFGGMIFLSIPARLATGHIADRARAQIMPLLLAGLFAFEAIAIAGYALFPGFASMLVLIVAQGIGAGAPTLVVLLICARLFGEENFGSVQGLMMFFQVPGTALAPVVAGFAYDWFGDYRIAAALFAGLLLAAAVAMGLVRLPPAPGDDPGRR